MAKITVLRLPEMPEMADVNYIIGDPICNIIVTFGANGVHLSGVAAVLSLALFLLIIAIFTLVIYEIRLGYLAAKRRKREREETRRCRSSRRGGNRSKHDTC